MNGAEHVNYELNRTKTRVFKMAGHWMWLCDDYHGGTVGNTYSCDFWRDAWSAALSGAVKHWMLYHADDEIVEVVEL